MKEGKKYVTVTTDASFDHEHSLGAFAYWISFDGGRIRHSGRLRTPPKNAECAELMAIGNALHAVLSSTQILSFDFLVINTDSTGAMNRIIYPNGNNLAEFCFDILQAIRKKFSLPKHFYKIKHVKAHLHTNTPRHYVNEWCDREAKIHLRQTRKEKQHGTI